MKQVQQMDRIDQILSHESFRYHMEENQRAEQGRIFCHHDMAHFLDVARIGEIMNLEQNLGLNREWIYAAALLHDVGKHVQYENGTPHETVSAEIAPQILRECGYDNYETGVIVDAIRNHRNVEIESEASLKGVLYRADKASRACFACEAECSCNWKGDKKNLVIRY